MSVIDLRKEFVKLQKEFVGGRVTKLKKHEVEHRLEVLKKAMSFKESDTAPAPARTGPPSARDIPTKEVVIDGETKITKPLKPEGPDPIVKKPRGPKKDGVAAPASSVLGMQAPAPAPTPAPSPVPVKEKKHVPPKVVFNEPEIKEPKKIIKKIKAPRTTPPAAEPSPAAPAPAPVVPPVITIKLPGGVRKIEYDNAHC